jgi:DNA polymerase elongation subunit (family B)
LFDAERSSEVTGKTLEKTLLCITKTIDKIMTGEIQTKNLVISKQLRMDIIKYKNIFPHVAAAIQLSNANDKKPLRGDIIQHV